ncbi:MAG: pyridoxamine 5'-phosphate oxidase family protein [Thermogemmatispora sp.]|uniref:pyridoxamine 5'-phosphate oxidase family protein n=1 Tax=Thermogemmatispora sp. TaxID=1968838 RepID=UPI0019F820F4|nr:pyridoxamine 5'-phosphate oxidase family protein [Thermogemmatispora sp.]MBE3568246.1 pyridoxamine 5'-phosphate oxidase family protein [Thermogemmatispora sp.]
MQGARTIRLTAEMKRVVEEQRLAFVATVCPDGTPNLSPKGTIAVWDDTHLIFADICSPGTIANLKERSALEINVVDPVARKGYRFKGRATVYAEGPLFERMLAFYRQRGTRSPIQHIVLITVEQASPLLSPAYDQGQSEQQIASRWLSRWKRLYTERYGPVLPLED